jgi:hypothetical protein
LLLSVLHKWNILWLAAVQAAAAVKVAVAAVQADSALLQV